MVRKKRNELNKVFKRKKEKIDLKNTLLVEKAKEDLSRVYDEEQKNYVKSKIKEIKDAHINHHSRLVWDTVNEEKKRPKTWPNQRKQHRRKSCYLEISLSKASRIITGDR